MANTKITSRVIADNAVTSSAIADGAITASKIASDAIDIVADTTPQLGGDLDVNGNAITGSTVQINGAGGDLMISATENGPVALRYDNNLKLTTKSDGVDITGELQSDSLDVDGDADISGTIALGNLTIAGAQGTDGQVLTSTGSGIAWEDAAGGGIAGIVSSADATAITIDSSENVGIGTGSPATKLHVEGTSKFTDWMYGNANGKLYINDDIALNAGKKLYLDGGSNTYLHQATADEIAFITDSAERARIDVNGYFLIRATTDLIDGGQIQLTSADNMYSMYVANTGFTGEGTVLGIEKGASSTYSFAQYYSGRRSDTGGGDREFNFRGDGNAYADGSFNNSGADYAEYFESHTGSAIPRGTSVVLENNKVRAATNEDNVADIIGVVRPKEFGKNSMVVGNTAWNMWSEKYLTDDFNCYVMEDYSVVSWNDENGELVTYESDNIPSDVTVPDNAETNTHDENGVKFQRRTLNPNFDDSRTYEPRENRDEWIIVGLIGQVQILDGQPTNDRWIKMRDISDTVKEWYIR